MLVEDLYLLMRNHQYELVTTFRAYLAFPEVDIIEQDGTYALRKDAIPLCAFSIFALDRLSPTQAEDFFLAQLAEPASGRQVFHRNQEYFIGIPPKSHAWDPIAQVPSWNGWPLAYVHAVIEGCPEIQPLLEEVKKLEHSTRTRFGALPQAIDAACDFLSRLYQDILSAGLPWSTPSVERDGYGGLTATWPMIEKRGIFISVDEKEIQGVKYRIPETFRDPGPLHERRNRLAFWRWYLGPKRNSGR